MARVEKCCCFELKTGTLIIATLGWIFTIVKIFGLIGVASGANDKPAEDEYGSSSIYREQRSNNMQTLYYRIGYAVVSLVVCVLLVVGIYKKRSAYFIPYLIVACLESIGCVIITCMFFIFIFTLPHPGNVVIGICFAFMVGITALSWYLWTVVYSYYHVVKAEGNPVPTGGNVYYSPTSNQPPPYEKDRAQLA